MSRPLSPLLRPLSLVLLSGSLGGQAVRAQASSDLRDDVRAIARGIEGGRADDIRRARRGAGAVGVLESATIDRLTFKAADSERGYRSLVGHASPAIRAHAAAGLGALFSQSARYGDAVVWFDSAQKHFIALGDSAGRAESYLGQGVAVLRTSGVPASRALLAQVRALAPANDEWIRAHLACTDLAVRVRAADSVKLAEFNEPRRTARLASVRAEAACLLAKIELLEGRGEVAGALASLDTLARIQQAGMHLNGLSATRQWQGWIHYTNGSYLRARAALEEAVRIGDSSGTLTSAGWANNALADLAQRVGSWADGARYARRAEQAFARAFDQPGMITARLVSGNVALAAGDLERASLTLASIQREVLQVFPRSAVEVLTARSDIARRSHDLARARVLLDSADLFARRYAQLGWNNELTYRRAMMALAEGRLADADRGLAEILTRLTALSPLLQYQVLARLAEVAALDGRITLAGERLGLALAQLDRWRGTLADRGMRLAASQTRGFDWDPDLAVATVIATIATRGSSSDALALADKRRARVLLDESIRRGMLSERATSMARVSVSGGLDSASIRAIDAGTAVVSYTTGSGGEPTTIFVMTRGRTSAVVTIASDSLADLARRFVAFLDAGHLARPASRRLASALMDPVLPFLPASVKRLVVIPDGSIHRVPFSALLLPNDSLLAQRYEIVTAPSVEIALHGLARLREGGRARQGVLAFGAPSAAVGVDEWAPLPGARDEMRGIERLVAGTEVIEGESATFGALRQASRQSGPVLHLATHARAMEGSLMSAAMVLSPEGGRDREASAPEIAAMTLPFDLVVLSACESANGSLMTGEGLQGLATALLEAGARGVLATRWRLEDRGARDFLDAFYESLIDGRDAASALARARRRAIADGVSPAIWANFELIGDPGVAPRLAANDDTPRLAGLAGVIALACVLAFVMRRGRLRTP